jgi:hypothetical protein
MRRINRWATFLRSGPPAGAARTGSGASLLAGVTEAGYRTTGFDHPVALPVRGRGDADDIAPRFPGRPGTSLTPLGAAGTARQCRARQA